MEWNPEVVRRVRGAMQDRARSQACLFKAFSSVMTREQAEALAREGIAEYGRIRAERDGRKLAPEDWMNEHYTMMGGVFETEISDTEEYCEMKMHYCPLLEEWKKMGLSPEDQDLFCDVAMELDRNRAKERHPVRYRGTPRQGRPLLPRRAVEKEEGLTGTAGFFA